MSKPHVIDVTVENFEKDVILASDKVPVLVDFWAPWCGPCKTLGPMLEKLAAEYGGRFILAKVNSDEQQDLAAAFQVRSIPTVIALKGKKPVTAFTGAQPESQLRAFIDKLVPSASDERLSKARELLEAGAADAAKDELKTALALDPRQDSARVMLAEIAFRDNALEEAENYLAAVSPRNQQSDDYQHMRARLDAANEATHLPEAAALQARVDADPNDFESRLQLATLYASQGQFEPAFQILLDIIERNRVWNDDAARKKLVEFFGIAQGEQPGLVSRYRRALATALN